MKAASASHPARKDANTSGGTPTVNCTGDAGFPCCYLQSSANITAYMPIKGFRCYQKEGQSTVSLTTKTEPFPHFWETGINSPHSAMTLRADWREHMTMLKEHMGYNFTRIHAPFARDYSTAQGPGEDL